MTTIAAGARWVGFYPVFAHQYDHEALEQAQDRLIAEQEERVRHAEAELQSARAALARSESGS